MKLEKMFGVDHNNFLLECKPSKDTKPWINEEDSVKSKCHNCGRSIKAGKEHWGPPSRDYVRKTGVELETFCGRANCTKN